MMLILEQHKTTKCSLIAMFNRNIFIAVNSVHRMFDYM